MPPPALSIVSPVFQSAAVVGEFAERAGRAAAGVTADFEVILVDDGSADASWERICAASGREPRVKGLKLSRNFGQHAAIAAGLAHAGGELVIVMDSDLQDDPRYIPELVAKARQGFDVVLTRRQRRQSAFRRAAAGLFYRCFNLLTNARPIDSGIGGYSLLSRRAVEALKQMKDIHPIYLMEVCWIGFRRTVIPVESAERYAGVSAYTFSRLLSVATLAIVSQSTKLLHLSIALGFAYVAAAAIGVIRVGVLYHRHGSVPGWPSTIVLLLGSTGLILASIGILGLYLGNVFDQVRGRPRYLVEEARNFPPRP